MKKENSMITWNDSDASSKAVAFQQFSEAGDSYAGVTKANHYRDFKDIEPNRSVRPGFRTSDYHAFRPDERVPYKQKRAIKMCMDAYEKVGIIRNVIDLMGDFGCQGINIVHENKSVEKFYQQWFKKCSGKERSERFLNLLYRSGQVPVYRSYANLTPEVVKYVKSIGQDITVEVPNFERNQIPWRYNFFNPVSLEVKDSNINLFLGRKNFQISPSSFLDNFKDGSIPAHMLDTLPVDIKEKIQNGERKITLDPERLSMFYYKKDDWSNWANPLIYAILDDVIMLEKMRLADLSALDGAISNIRLWTLGNLDHKILPNKAAINKLRDILASNVGGGTMELVWGPELSYTESNSQVYKFLGSEKYNSVLNSIYAGLGVPPTLTGMAGNGGGFTNNFISLKTLVERLQYGRDQLTAFWEKECEIVRKAMGFRKSPHITYDQMSLSDESSEKNLLIQLADRDIISHETVLERFKEVPSVEKMRLRREDKARDSETLPEKAGPFHPPPKPQDMKEEANLNQVEKTNDSDPSPGRPLFSKDEEPRKKRVEKPKSKPGVAELITWVNDSFDKISEITTAAYLGVLNKKNMRGLAKSQSEELEQLKLHVLSNIEPLSEVTTSKIQKVIGSTKKMPKDFSNSMEKSNINLSNLNTENFRRQAISCYIQYVLDN
tara:strand:- start:12082 stop:14076 length:1995 start_codon:yes stop_codon:yes gene_type:complete